MPLRRNLRQLQESVAEAPADRIRATALYRLAVFHDGNGREALAIPHYRRAIALGLDRQTETRALAWLASSLYKTGRAAAATRCVKRALGGTCSSDLRRFLTRLQARIDRVHRRGPE